MASSAEKLFRLQSKGIKARKDIDKEDIAAKKKAGKWSMWGNIGRGIGTIAGGFLAASLLPAAGLAAGAWSLGTHIAGRAAVAGATTFVSGKLAQAGGVAASGGGTGRGAGKKWMKSDLAYKGPLYKGSQSQMRTNISSLYSQGLQGGVEQSLMAGAVAGATAGYGAMKTSPKFKHKLMDVAKGTPHPTDFRYKKFEVSFAHAMKKEKEMIKQGIKTATDPAGTFDWWNPVKKKMESKLAAYAPPVSK